MNRSPDLERPGPTGLGEDIRAFCREHGLNREDAAQAIRYAEGLVTRGTGPVIAERRALKALRARFEWHGLSLDQADRLLDGVAA